MNSIVFTIISNNYLAYASTLMQSVRSFMPNTKRYIFICDEKSKDITEDFAAEFIMAKNICKPFLADMVLRYSTLELNTAIKPFAFKSFLDSCSDGPIIYLDPDIWVVSPLVEVVKSLEMVQKLLLTPHITGPLTDDKEPSDHDIMKSGIWNLGFVGMRASPHTKKLVDWWCQKCETQCLSDVSNNLFTDQRWMDMAPAFVPATKLLMHPGYNVAYWNLSQRNLTRKKNGDWYVNGKYPLRFFHFSGIVPDDASVVSKHQNRFVPEQLGELNLLFDEYRSALLANKWQETRGLPYAFSFTSDGRVIADVTRSYFREQFPKTIANRFKGHQEAIDWYADWLLEPAPEHPLGLPRLMVAVALARPDVAEAFDNATPAGAQAFAAWFKEKATLECGISAPDVDAALLIAERAIAKSLQIIPPSISPVIVLKEGHVLQGSNPILSLPDKAELGVWMRQSIPLLKGTLQLPLGLCLPLYVRGDLRDHFPLTNLRGVIAYLMWLFSSGFKEGWWTKRLSEEFFAECSPVLRGNSQEISSLSLSAVAGGLSPLLLVAAEQYDGSFGQLTGSGKPWSSDENMARTLCFVQQRFLANNAYPSLVAMPVEHFLLNAHELVSRQTGLHLPVFIHTIWSARPDLRSLFPGDTPQSWLGLIGWYVLHGQADYESSFNVSTDSAFWEFLASPWGKGGNINTLQIAVFCARPDLTNSFDMRTSLGQRSYLGWVNNLASDANFSDSIFAPLLHTKTVQDSGNEDSASLTQVLYKARTSAAAKVIRVVGHFNLTSGRAEDARTLAAALESAGYKVEKIDRNEVPGALSRMREGNCVLAIHVLNAETAYVDWVWREAVGAVGEINIGYWAWELETLPTAWQLAYAFYDEIWGNSKFCTKALKQFDLRPVRCLPLAIAEIEPSHTEPLGLDHLPEGHFCFLFSFDFGSFHERKNPQGVVKAFLKAFPSLDEEVVLVIKAVQADLEPLAWHQLVACCKNDPRITLVNDSFTRGRMDALFERADAYVSLHRAEGFGRGMAEALLRGMPVIATDYSGSEEICRPSTAYLVDYELIPIREGEYVDEAVSFLWAEPNLESAAMAMQQVFKNPKQAIQRARKGKALVQKEYSVQAIGQMAQGYLQDLLSSRKRVGKKVN